MAAAKKVTKTIARSAKTGKLVSKAEAKANPDTTVVETVVKFSLPKDPDKFKIPKNMAEVADLAYQLREERLRVQKETEAIGKLETRLKEHLIQNLPKSAASGVSGKVANAKIVKEVVPHIDDKKKFLAHVKKTGDFSLITAGMNPAAIKERWENKKKVPGIGEFTIVKVSLTKTR